MTGRSRAREVVLQILYQDDLNPDADPADIVPSGLPALRAHLERFCEVGFSKFVLVPAGEPTSWDDELGELASEVLTLQN